MIISRNLSAPMIDFVMLPIPPPMELPMKRFISLFVVVVLSFSICTFAFALEDIPDFDSDFVRYAPSAGTVTVGSDSVSIVVPWVVHSSTGTKSVRGIDAQCHALGSQHGHFTFVIIVGSRNNPSLYSNPQRVSIETIDSDTDLHYYDSYLRPTNYRFNYSHRVSDTEVKEFSCIPFVVEFDIPEGETFTSLYQTNNQTFVSVSGEYVTSAFFLYSSTKNTSIDHLSAIEDYLSIVPYYFQQYEDWLITISDQLSYIDETLSDVNYWYVDFYQRFRTNESKNATWSNFPSVNDPFSTLADYLHATIAEKTAQDHFSRDLSDLNDLREDVQTVSERNLPTFVNGIRDIFNFFDPSDSGVVFDFTGVFFGYEDYFGNVPFFFTSDIESRLEVQ